MPRGRIGPRNRLLAVALVLGGRSAGCYFGAAVLSANEATARLAIGIGVTFLIPLPAVYLLFLATVRTRFTRVLRARGARWALAAYTLVVGALWVMRPRAFVDELGFYPSIGGWHVVEAGPLLSALALGALALAELFGLLVVVSAYRNANRGRARAGPGVRLRVRHARPLRHGVHRLLRGAPRPDVVVRAAAAARSKPTPRERWNLV